MLLVAYDGTSFHGFAAQKDQYTVGGQLAKALGSMAGHEVSLTCAGRTDAGVHALGQVVHVDLDERIVAKWAARSPEPGKLLERLGRSLSRQLGPAIAVIEARVAPDGFDARHSATARRYRYSLLRTPWPDPLAHHSSWHVPGTLDLAAMRIGTDALLGEHDFSAFCRLPHGESARAGHEGFAGVLLGPFFIAQNGDALGGQSPGQIAKWFIGADGLVPVVRPRAVDQDHRRPGTAASGRQG